MTNEISFEDAVDELTGPLSTYLRRMTGNAADADDLLQETLMRIARALPGFEGRSKLKTWAYHIATNVAIDFFRKSGKKQFVEFDESVDASEDFDEEDRLVVDEMNSCIRQVIDTLPPDYRAVAVLYNVEGLTAAQVAETCGVSLATAKIRIHRAKSRLQEALEKKCDFYHSTDGNIRCDSKSKN